MILRYYPVLPAHPDSGIETAVRSLPWQLGDGHWVVKIKGRAGGVSLQHLTPHYR